MAARQKGKRFISRLTAARICYKEHYVWLSLFAVNGENNTAMFNMLVILYLFFGGCGGGLLLIVSAWSLFFHRHRHRSKESTKTFDDIKKIGYTSGFLLVALASACLLFDLGRPQNILVLFIQPSFSVLSIGTFILTATLILSFLLMVTNQITTRVSSKIKKAAEVLCAVSSSLLIVYVGVFLQNMATVPFWSSYAIPVLFAFSSLSTGAALVFLILPLKGSYAWQEREAHWLHVCHRVFVVLELLTLIVLIGQAVLNERAGTSLALLFGPDFVLWFIVGALGFGIVAPLLGELVYSLQKRKALLPFFSVLCLIGGFCLRYCIVSVGAH